MGRTPWGNDMTGRDLSGNNIASASRAPAALITMRQAHAMIYCAGDRNSSLLAVPVGMPLSLFKDAALTIVFLTVAGDEPGLLCRTRAATPATCGLAIDVPLKVAVAVSLVRQADTMLEPGAKISTTLPKFENDERASFIVEEPTVMAALTRAGEELEAFVFELPAATA